MTIPCCSNNVMTRNAHVKHPPKIYDVVHTRFGMRIGGAWPPPPVTPVESAGGTNVLVAVARERPRKKREMASGCGWCAACIVCPCSIYLMGSLSMFSFGDAWCTLHIYSHTAAKYKS